MKKVINIITIVGATLLIFSIGIISTLLPDKEKSVLESRDLATLPNQITLESYKDRTFANEIETYLNDNLFLRETFMEIYTDSQVLMGRQNINSTFKNGNYYSAVLDEEYYTDYLLNSWTDSLMYVNEQCLENDIDFVTIFIPNKANFSSDKIPSYYNTADLNKYFEYFSNTLSDNNYKSLYLGSEFQSLIDKNNQLYYNTDHHWTSLGAYWGYTYIIDYLNKVGVVNSNALALDEFGLLPIDKKFYGSTLRTFGGTCIFNSNAEYVDILYYTGNNLSLSTNTLETVSGSYLDVLNAYTKDYDVSEKYFNFYNYNFPSPYFSPIFTNNDNPNAPSVLLVTDSFSQALMPMLTANFSKIQAVDCRYFESNLVDYAKDNQYDSIIYMVSSLTTDRQFTLQKQKAQLSVSELTASSSKQGVKLAWTSTSSDTAEGYDIYRKIGSENSFEYLSSTTDLNYTDTNASKNEFCFYKVYPYTHDENGNKILGESKNYSYGKKL